jgi:hypothetical protein
MIVPSDVSRRRCMAALTLSLASLFVLSPVVAKELPVAAEKSPPGDIPDTQVFVDYASPLGFTIQVPEGWARKERADGAVFNDKYGRVEVSVVAATGVPTAASVRTAEAADLQKTGHAVKLGKIEDVRLPSGAAVLIKFLDNSEPNAVTNKQIRLENDRYLIAKGDKLAVVTFSAPAGADNVDQWQLMSRSFGWK